MLCLDAFLANFNVVVRIAGFFSCKENEIWANSNAEFEQNKLYYITKGNCIINIEGKEYYGKEGCLFFIPANTKHSYHNIQSGIFEKYWLHFDLYPNSTLFKFLNLNYCINVKDDTFLYLFDELVRKYKSDQLTDKLDVKSLLIRIISSYIATSPRKSTVALSVPDEKVSVVLSYINQNLGKTISNSELSALCYMHPNHFVRYFKKVTGSTPQKYITEQRVQMAKRLIEQTDLKFSDIAERVGFCDAPHLTKVFKQYFSLTPQACRKLCNRY